MIITISNKKHFNGKHSLNAYNAPDEPFPYFWRVVIIAEQVSNIMTVTKQRRKALKTVFKGISAVLRGNLWFLMTD